MEENDLNFGPSAHRRRSDDPARSGRSYPAPGLMLAPGRERQTVLTIIGIPFVFIVVLFVAQPWTAFAGGPSGLPGFSFGGTTNGGNGANVPQYGNGYGYNSPSPSQAPQYPYDTGTPTPDGVGPSGGGGYGGDSPLVTDSPSPSPSPSFMTGPAGTVQQYFAAINNHDYAQAWSLGGANLGESYAAFTAGFANTATDTPAIVSVTGDVVALDLTAIQTDGTRQTYTGTYTVVNGVITGAHLARTS